MRKKFKKLTLQNKIKANVSAQIDVPKTTKPNIYLKSKQSDCGPLIRVRLFN